MDSIKFFTYGATRALEYAIPKLMEKEYAVLPYPNKEITHLILPVPSFDAKGNVNGAEEITSLLEELPKDITIIGGNLTRPELTSYKKLDLLQDPQYLDDNAYITAHCALQVAMERSDSIISEKRVLIIGWGRIGKHLAGLLSGIGSDVTVASTKKPTSGILTIETRNICPNDYDLIFNTAPAPVVNITGTNALGIDLASVQGIAGDCVIARGLPGKYAPESSGQLIAKTIDRLLRKDVSL